MKLLAQDIEFEPLHSATPMWRASASSDALTSCCKAVRDAGGRLVALWGSDERDGVSGKPAGFALHIALAIQEGLLLLDLALPADSPTAPDLSEIFPYANRMQRATRDMLGIAISGGDARSWLHHANWPADFFPLRHDADASASFDPVNEEYAFVRVEGDGVHEIAVGPIHAGIIEPGHFRFSVVGEKVLRLEARLGYVHKGIEKRFESLTLNEGYRLAGRVSGDSTVAYAWAYCQALEALCRCPVPPRALWLRALLLERERVANHLGDLGALGNDAGLGFGLAQFMRLKEDWLRLNQEVFSHRYLMDRIVPGGTSCDLKPGDAERLTAQCDAIQQEVKLLKNIYDDHAGLQDRFLTTGHVTPQLAAQLGLIGMAGRASGQTWDLRVEAPCAPYDQLDTSMVTHRNGDVAARVIVRFEEAMESLRLIRDILRRLPAGETRAPLPPAAEGSVGVGWIEGWRGEILVALEAGANGGIRRCHCHDPSWQNWPVLEHAVIGNIVPDFPLINKSFNLSYSGQDL